MINEIQQRHLKEEVDCSLEYAYHLAYVGNPLDGVRSTGEDDEEAKLIFLDIARVPDRFNEKVIQEKARTARMFLRHLWPEEKE
ncbi:MAG: hypothetical protein K6C41_08990 [Lachnospiraceae bacterium]|nr:hypothetical protein [Lachnospiraceae bacterium]